MGSSEDNDLIVLAGLDEAFDYVWANVDASIDSFIVREVDFEDDVGLLLFHVINTVDQGFIHVEDQQLFL